jgi:putative MATE family efflux protein
MLGTGKIGSLLWHFSIPAIIGMLANASYNIINRIFVGHAVGGVAIAAITVAFPIVILFMGISLLIGVGATTLISIRLGQKKIDEAETIMGHALTWLFVLPLLFCVGMFFYIEPSLILLGATADLLPYAIDYLTIIMPGLLIMSISMGMNNVIRAEGSPRTAMLTQIVGGGVNVISNYFFVMVFGWGVRGAAFGVLLGQVVSLTLVMSYFLMPNRSFLKFKVANMLPQFKYTRDIVKVGFAPFILQVVTSVQQLLVNRSLSFYGGGAALTAFGIIGSLAMLLVMPLFGINQGIQPIIGYNYGAARYDRVRETLKKAAIYATIFSFMVWVIIRLFPNQMVGIFMPEEYEITALTARALVIFFALLMTIGFQVIASGYFQAIGKPFHATVLSLSRQILFYIPLLLILPRFLQIDGVWLAAPFADLAAFIMAGFIVFFELRKNNMLTAKDAQAKTEAAMSVL